MTWGICSLASMLVLAGCAGPFPDGPPSEPPKIPAHSPGWTGFGGRPLGDGMLETHVVTARTAAPASCVYYRNRAIEPDAVCRVERTTWREPTCDIDYPWSLVVIESPEWDIQDVIVVAFDEEWNTVGFWRRLTSHCDNFPEDG